MKLLIKVTGSTSDVKYMPHTVSTTNFVVFFKSILLINVKERQKHKMKKTFKKI